MLGAYARGLYSSLSVIIIVTIFLIFKRAQRLLWTTLFLMALLLRTTSISLPATVFQSKSSTTTLQNQKNASLSSFSKGAIAPSCPPTSPNWTKLWSVLEMTTAVSLIIMAIILLHVCKLMSLLKFYICLLVEDCKIILWYSYLQKPCKH